MQHVTISLLKQSAGAEALSASFDAQLSHKAERETKTGKPFYEITLVDATGEMKLKVWDNRPQFRALQDLECGALLRLSGDWTQNQYGMDSAKWDMRLLSESEASNFLAGDPETRKRQEADWHDISQMIDGIKDVRLHGLCAEFVRQYEAKYRRAAAARKNHHARRGGLVEHVAQMMRTAHAICDVYPKLNRDLLTAGVLFHDCGKMWENNYAENGFTQPHNLHGEMLGHIPLGIEVVNKLWRDLLETNKDKPWDALVPSNEDVRLHLLHLIASHHGAYEWGSPTLPRTPEAMALHYIDNLDAKYEMMRQAYDASPELAPGIQERQFPLPANLVQPLPHTCEGKIEKPIASDETPAEIEEELF